MKEGNPKKMKKEDDNNSKELSYHHFRLFSYLAMSIITIAILVGVYIIIQHDQEEEAANKSIDNQKSIMENQQLLIDVIQNLRNNSQQSIENQQLLKELGEDSKQHEIREEGFLGNNTNTNINISQSNSERLDLLLEHFNITYK